MAFLGISGPLHWLGYPSVAQALGWPLVWAYLAGTAMVAGALGREVVRGQTPSGLRTLASTWGPRVAAGTLALVVQAETYMWAAGFFASPAWLPSSVAFVLACGWTLVAGLATLGVLDAALNGAGPLKALLRGWSRVPRMLDLRRPTARHRLVRGAAYASLTVLSMTLAWVALSNVGHLTGWGDPRDGFGLADMLLVGLLWLMASAGPVLAIAALSISEFGAAIEEDAGREAESDEPPRLPVLR